MNRLTCSTPLVTLLGRRAPLPLLLALFMGAPLNADSIRGSAHDLSSNTNSISTQVCMYCHTPHHANNTLTGINAPLWNRVIDPNTVFTVYGSPTMNTTPGNPNTTNSALCLGCHDGSLSTPEVAITIYGTSFNQHHEVINGSSLGQKGEEYDCFKCHSNIGEQEKWWVGKNLSNMHPIAMTYPTAAQDPAFRTPPDLQQGWPDMKLFAGRIECATCHKVHDPAIKPFLRKSNDGSALCLTCHIK